MFKRILHIVSDKQQEKQLVAELARANDSAVMLAALLLVGCGHEVSAEGATRRRVLREDRERSCWQALYRLEEEFKASGIKASVMAREGDVDDIHTLANNINADLIVLHASSLAGANYRLPDEFIASLPCPIFIVNTE